MVSETMKKEFEAHRPAARWLAEHGEVLRYLFFGVLTTLLNILLYGLFLALFGYQAANSWGNVLDNALCILYGQPPKTFDFIYTDKAGVYHCDPGLTPKGFFEKYVGDNLDDYQVVIASPIHPLNRTFCQPYMGDVVEENMFWLNLTLEEMEDLTVRQLQAGEPVFFSCDCHPDRDRELGYWDPDSFQYGAVLGGLDLEMSRADCLTTRESRMNHCMIFCGVNLGPDGKPDRWKIENSWGDASGQKGYFIGSEKWFERYVYQVTVRKDLLSDAQRALLAQEPLPMALWDPLA